MWGQNAPVRGDLQFRHRGQILLAARGRQASEGGSYRAPVYTTCRRRATCARGGVSAAFALGSLLRSLLCKTLLLRRGRSHLV